LWVQVAVANFNEVVEVEIGHLEIIPLPLYSYRLFCQVIAYKIPRGIPQA
jgi:hypothetical protein